MTARINLSLIYLVEDSVFNYTKSKLVRKTNNTILWPVICVNIYEKMMLVNPTIKLLGKKF